MKNSVMVIIEKLLSIDKLNKYITNIPPCTIVLVLLSFFINNAIQRSINSLICLMSEISRNHDLTRVVGESGKDKLADMVPNFNSLLASVRRLIGNIQSTITELSATSE